MRYACCDERRLVAVSEAGVLNAIEYLEVSHSEAPTPALRQRTLFVHLVKPVPAIGPQNVTITGGRRIPTVGVEWVAPASALPATEDPALVAGIDEPARVLVVRTAARGDFSTYTLRLVAASGSNAPPAGFDPLLASVDFSFKVECPSDFDCAPVNVCPPEPRDQPALDYLAKDYATFRKLMLDRMSLLAPGWAERVPADLGVALVEVLAYVADELSYRQDAVATEAYLSTARRRTSLRRHARLVDHAVHDGCNARVWVRVDVTGEAVELSAKTPLLTRVPGLPAVMEPGNEDHRAALAAGAETFETTAPAVLYESHRRFDFWTWGDAGCCLSRGATSATLVGDHPELKAGDVLVLAEIASPTDGLPGAADPAKRAAVRLTHVVASTDPAGGSFATPPTSATVEVTEIAWDAEDALPFPLCISTEKHPGLIVSAAWGNVVLADHGRTVVAEPLGTVPAPILTYAQPAESSFCEEHESRPVPVRFRPALRERPVTNARPPAAPVAEGPASPALLAALDAATFAGDVEIWLRDRGFSFTAGPAVVRGGDGVWSVGDGATVAILTAAGTNLEVHARPPSANATTAGNPAPARPALTATSVSPAGMESWRPRRDLLGSNGEATDVVVETEHDGSAALRFGNGVHGRRVEPGAELSATYRVGNGIAGNVGAGALAHVVSVAGSITGITNPMAARGGVEPETAEEIRRDAPEAFLAQLERAVTRDDYARLSERSPHVQQAAATFRWTGSWHTVFVTADRSGGLGIDPAFESTIRTHLEPYRMAGYDLEVDAPQFVSLEISLRICVAAGYFAAHVGAAVKDALSSGLRTDGAPGYFHPDRFTLGTSVYLSPVVAAAQAVPGVESMTPLTFRRQRDPGSSGLAAGVLPMGRLEVPRLDNDPNFPEHGILVVTTGGGQ